MEYSKDRFKGEVRLPLAGKEKQVFDHYNKHHSGSDKDIDASLDSLNHSTEATQHNAVSSSNRTAAYLGLLAASIKHKKSKN